MKKTKIVMSIMLLAGILLPALNVTNAGKLYFTSDSDTLIKNCPTEVKIMIDTEGDEVNSAGVNVILNDTFTVNKFSEEGGVFRDYVKARYYDAKKGEYKGQKFLNVVGTTSSANGFNGEGTFGTYTITAGNVDEVELGFYMIEDFNGEDSNLVMITDDGNKDVLTSAETKIFKVVEGECTVEAMPELTEEDITTTVNAEDVEEKVEDIIDVIDENVFDASQETTRLQTNWIYVAIALVALILILLIATKSKKDKKGNKKETKKSK